jgi:hypothetical protein
MQRSRNPLSRAARCALLTLCLIGVHPAASPAQDAAPWIEMTIVGVDPGRVGEFLAAQRELSALDKDAGVPWRSVSRTAIFGDTYRFIVMTPLADFARLDRFPDADPARAAIIARIRGVITSRTTYALRTTPGIDNPLPDDAEPSLSIVQVVSVAAGREQDYLRVMAEDVLPHFEEAEMHHTSGAITFGGESGFVHFFHVGSFAALDQGSPLARALGAHGAQEVMGKLSGVVRRSEQWLVRYLAEASLRAEPEPEDQP